jgi:predicted nucleic acid-binding protein
MEVSGGRVYDALIAATARHHAQALATCDVRARSVYERMGADVVWIG